MNPLPLPWFEIAVAVPIIGAAMVRIFREPGVADRVAVISTGAALVAAMFGWLSFLRGWTADRSLAAVLLGRPLFEVDAFSAPLVPLVAAMHLLTVLLTARVKRNRMSYTGHLIGESFRLGTVACLQPWPLIALLILACIPPAVELFHRGKSLRVYAFHMALFATLLVVGWLFVEAGSDWGAVALFAAVLIRTGNFPAHLWFADLCENASFGTALLFLTPIASVYAAFRLVLPTAPDWALQGIGIVSLITAVLAAGLAVVQTEIRRFTSYVFLSQSSLILVGLELRTATSLTGALCLWISLIVALGGFGLILRAVEARFGLLDLKRHHGLYEHGPQLAIGFLLMGLSSIGFPGTLGFIAAELLIDGVVEANVPVGVGLLLAALLNGIAIVRVYLLIFTGVRLPAPHSAVLKPRKRFAILALCAFVLGGGLVSNAIVVDRHAAALSLIEKIRPQQRGSD